MHPVLLEYGRVILYSYGLCVAIGAGLGLWYMRAQAARADISVKRIYDLFFYIIVAGLLGGRFLYVVINLRNFNSFIDIFKIWEGGLVFYGGFAAGFGMFFFLVKKWSVPPLPVLDIIAPAIALGHAFGRLGCFFAGCCYGLPTTLPWAIRFTDPHTLGPIGELIHPTQLYSFLGNTAIFVWLHHSLKKRTFNGEVISRYLVLYGLFRFCVEFLRNDPRGPLFLSLTMMQYISIVLVSTGCIILFKKKKFLVPARQKV